MEATPALRLLVRRGRVIRGRPRVLGAALVGAVRPGRQPYMLWPSDSVPEFALRPASAAPAQWMRHTFERQSRGGRFARAHVWHALRSRAAVVGEASDLWRVAAERGLGRELTDPDVGIASSSGCRNKVTLFVFEGGERPVAVVKVMADPWRPEWLAHEYRLLKDLRRRVEQAEMVLAALPEPPLYEGDVDGEHVVVERFDPAAQDVGAGDTERHLRFLWRMQEVTRGPERAWTAADAEAVLLRSARALETLPDRSGGPRVLERVRAELEAAVGATVADVAVHGDFWRGNISASPVGLRVFDWEWGELAGHPAFDRWTYDLAELRAAAAAREPGIAGRVRQSLDAVTADLVAHGVDARFGRAMLLPVAIELTARLRIASASGNGWEEAAPALLSAIEEVLR